MKRKLWLAVIVGLLFMTLPAPASAMDIPNGLYLVADDGAYTYLGKLTANTYDAESIYNPYGTYGSKYSSQSIFNQYGTYGSKYSSYSPFNQYSYTPPLVVLASNNTTIVVGRLTINTYLSNSWSPYTLYGFLQRAGY